jgi:hypothetical protein
MKRIISFALALVMVLGAMLAVSCGTGDEEPTDGGAPSGAKYDGVYTSKEDPQSLMLKDGMVYMYFEGEYEVNGEFVYFSYPFDLEFGLGDDGLYGGEYLLFTKTSGDKNSIIGEYKAVVDEDLMGYIFSNAVITVDEDGYSLASAAGTYTDNGDSTLTITSDYDDGEQSKIILGDGYFWLGFMMFAKEGVEVDEEAALLNLRAHKNRAVTSKLEGKTYVNADPESTYPYSAYIFGKDTLSIIGPSYVTETNVEYDISCGKLFYDNAGSGYTGADFYMEGESIFIGGNEFIPADSDILYVPNSDGVSCTVLGTKEMGDMIVIPEKLGGLVPTTIVDYAFDGMKKRVRDRYP